MRNGFSRSNAAVQRLGNLTLLYDDNHISIEDDTNIALSEDVAGRYAALGWHVQRVDWLDDKSQQLDQTQKKLVNDTCAYISANPLTSIGLAVLAGMLLSRMTRSSS